MKEIKRVFLYVKKMADNSKIDKVAAISEDEKHKFEFSLRQDDYDASAKALKTAFEKFCVEECGFDNSAYCDVWALNDDVLDKNFDFQNDIGNWLGSVDWCCHNCVEFEFINKNFHLKNPTSFDEFKIANGYDESKEPFETKRLYYIFKTQIDKKKFSEQEVKRIVQFIEYNGYSKLFEAVGKNYPMRIKLREALCALYRSNKQEYEKQIAKLCDAVVGKINVMLRRIVGILSELPADYHEEYDYDDWVDYECNDENDGKPIYLRKYFDIIPEGEMKYMIYAFAAADNIKGKSRAEINMDETKRDEVRRRVDEIAFETGRYFGIRHYDIAEDDDFNDIIAKYPDRKDEIDELYDKSYRQGVFYRINELAADMVCNQNKSQSITEYGKYLENNPDMKDDIVYEFNKTVYRVASNSVFKKWAKELIE